MKRGFTMIELVLVVTILGILAISALPAFYDMTTKAKTAVRSGVVGSIRSGIDLWHMQSIVSGNEAFPEHLDNSLDARCVSANPCFGAVLAQPIVNGSWMKSGDVYTFEFKEGVYTDYTYDPVTGAFTSPDAP